VINSAGNTVSGTVSVVKSAIDGDCPAFACIIKFSAFQSLGQGSYTVTFNAFGVSGSPQPAYNANAYARNVIQFTVTHTLPPAPPANVTGPSAITQANVSAVPFTGYA